MQAVHLKKSPILPVASCQLPVATSSIVNIHGCYIVVNVSLLYYTLYEYFATTLNIFQSPEKFQLPQKFIPLKNCQLHLKNVNPLENA